MTNWNDRRFVGSGFAQSMLLHGQPLLAGGGDAKPIQIEGEWRDPSFGGVITLWWVREYEGGAHWLVRWRSAGRGATVPLWTLCKAYEDFGDYALAQRSDPKIDEILGRHDEGYANGLDEAMAKLVLTRAEEIIDGEPPAGFYFGTVPAAEFVDGAPCLVSPRGRRPIRLPFNVMVWAGVHVPEILEELRTTKTLRLVRPRVASC
jgi:hypothetical protein